MSIVRFTRLALVLTPLPMFSDSLKHMLDSLSISLLSEPNTVLPSWRVGKDG